MAETKTATVEPQAAPAWKPGQIYIPGQPVPDGAIVCEQQGGMPTLEMKGPDGFDSDLRGKMLRQLDEAFRLAHKDPDEQSPKGKRPWVLYVNRPFRNLFRGVRMWGELEPPCEVEITDVNDKRFLSPSAIRLPTVGGVIVKAVFSTVHPDAEE